MTRTPVSTKNAPAVSPNLMNQAIIANGFVFTSGGVAMDPKSGKMIDGDIEAHTVSELRTEISMQMLIKET
jgi:enamine deaminase RidA (YjgF/YER057c/UK114 family)